MSGDTWLRAIAVLVCVAFALRAASAMCTDAARAWYEKRADVARYLGKDKGFVCESMPTHLPEKPWYVKLHEWGRW